jgi:adenine-specific DNA-methyltransferase
VKGAAKKAEIDAGLADGRYRLIPRGDGHIVGRLRPLDQDGSKFYSVLKHLTKDAKDALAPLGLDGLFPNPKPLSLLTELVMGATRFTPNDGQIVLDFFAGSATTAHAVLDANASDGGNRRFVLVQLPEVCAPGSTAAQAGFATIADLAQERVRRVGASLSSGDRGMRVLTVVDRESPVRAVDLAQDELVVASGGSPEELLFQVLVDGGYDLAAPISVETIAGSEVFVVGGLVACFEEKVTEELVEGLVARGPGRAVLLDSAFGDDAARMNAEAAFVGAGVEVVFR